MDTAKIFENGRSQAVRLPKEYRFNETEVGIARLGDIVILFPKEKAKDIFLDGINNFSDDFMEEGRKQGSAETRHSL